MRRSLIILLVLLTVFTPRVTRAQGSNLATLLKQCTGRPVDERPVVGISHFTKSNPEINDKYVDLIGNMLYNTLIQSNCFRMTKMPDMMSTVTPVIDPSLAQYSITGDLVMFTAESKTKKIFFKAKTITVANISFNLQVRSISTGEALLSKDLAEQGNSETRESALSMILPVILSWPADSSGAAPTDPSVDKAFLDALEKGVRDAAAFIMQNQLTLPGISAPVVTTDPTIPVTDTTTTPIPTPTGEAKQASITIANLSFAKLLELENEFKARPGVTNVEKSMKNGEGTLTFLHLGTDDDLVNILTAKFGDTIEITGFEPGKITARIKT